METSAGKKVVLVAEDEPAVRDVVSTVLERAGHKVVLAEDGEKALEIFLEMNCTVDLILTDISMPVLDGVSFARSVRFFNPKTPIIMMSALEVPKLETPLCDAPFIRKPFTLSNLKETVRQVMNVAPAA